MAIRFIVEVAWQAHFVTNMFIKPSAEELENFEPDFVVYNASKAKVSNYKELGLNSETAVAFNITSREQVIINTWYGGEMKKGMFSMMNMVGMTTVYSTSRVAAMLRLLTLTKSPSRIFTMQLSVTLFLRTLLWMRMVRLISQIRA